MTDAARVDARLVPCAAAAWAVTVLGLYTGPRIAAAVAVAAILAAGSTCLVAKRASARRPRRSVATVSVVVAMCAVTAGFGVAVGIRMWFVDTHPVTEAAEKRAWVTMVLEPTDDPKKVRRAGFGGEPQVRIPAGLERVTIAGRTSATGGSVLVFAPAEQWSGLLPGQAITVRGRLSPAPGPGTLLAVIRVEGAPLVVAAPPPWQRWAGTVRERLARACAGALTPAQAGLLPGLVVGDTSALTEKVREDFRVAGLTHLTAVSGANVSIVLGAVLLVVRAVGVGPRTGTVLAGLALVLFVVVVRPSPSVLRAAAMGAIALLALVSGRERHALPALGAAVGVLLVLAPDLAVDVGFALSVSATAALVVVAPVLVARLRAWGWPRAVAEVTAVSVAAFAVTAPIMAAVTGTVSLVAVAANMLVAPVVAPLTVLGSGIAVAATLHSGAGELLARGGGPLLWWMLEVAHRAASLPSAEVPVPEGLAGAAAVCVVLIFASMMLQRRTIRIVVGVALLSAAAVWVPVRILQPGWPGTEWMFVACDVGQGDALVLAAGDGRAVVIDTGAETEPVNRCLQRLRIHTVRMLVLTHLHADHTGGAAGVLDGRKVGAVVVGAGTVEREGGEEIAALAAAYGVPVRETAPGDEFRVGPATVRVLGPAGPATTENDSSLVLVADTPAGRILLPGDAEERALDALVRSGVDVRADVLKVPHHGSRTTPERFLIAVRPRVAVVGTGRDNTFGHPHPEIVATLRGLGTRVFDTARHGDIAVVRAGSGALAVVSDERDTIEP